ncbi:MAG: hypothetical protein D6733_07120 [Methanobacteriota archaeon]|nr:MAG: hypothetical protein D6733_07120 [Euryarchaeota archaeon]
METSIKDDKTKVMIDVLERMEKEIGSALETIEVQSDRETLESIERGLADIREGRARSFDSFLKAQGLG